MLNYNLSDNYEGSLRKGQGWDNFYLRRGAPRGGYQGRGGGRDEHYDYRESSHYGDCHRYRDWTIGEAHTESGEVDQGACLHLEVDFADLGQEGGMLDPTVLQDDHQSIRQENKNDQMIDPFNRQTNRISLRRMNLEEIFEMKTTRRE